MARTGFFAFARLRPGGQGMVFLICFLIAAIIWIVNALSKSYTTTYKYTVTINAASQKAEEVRVALRGSGFSLLRLYYRMNNNAFEKYTAHQLSSLELTDSIIGDLKSNVQVLRSEPPVLSGILAEGHISKKIPVRGKIDITYANQFGSILPVMFKPDSITITGPSAVVDSTSYIETVHLKVTALSAPLFRSVSLHQPSPNVLLSHSRVWMYVKTEQFTEQKLDVPVTVYSDRSKAFPDKVTLSFQVPLSRYNEVKPSQFKAEVRHQTESSPGKYPVKLVRKPYYARNLTIIPEEVALLIFE
jgi:YbbR domain-containing protein